MFDVLKNLAEIRAGHPFRGSVPAVDGGDAMVVQMRDVAADGTVGWTALTRTSIAGARPPDWLRDGDVLFAARGGRNYAVCLSDVPPRTVCAPHFFVLRLRAGAAQVLPAYLAWHLNSGPSRRYLAGHAEGTDQLSIRRAVLEDTPIAVLSLERQRLLVALADAAMQERRCLEALVRSRDRELDALAHRLLTPDTVAVAVAVAP